MFEKLEKINAWHFVWISIVISAPACLILNTIQSYLWWGFLSFDLLIIGTIDSLVLCALVSPIGVYFVMKSRTRAEERLRDSERRLSLILDSISDGFYAIDSEWRFTHVNDAALRHFQKTREELIGHPLLEVFPAVRGSAFEKAYRRAMQSGEPIHIEGKAVLSDRILAVHAYPGFNNMTVLFQDITYQYQLAAALNASQRRVAHFFNLGLVGMAIEKPDGKWIDVNERLCQMSGYSREELLSKHWHDLTHPEDLEKNLDQFQQLLNGKIEQYVLEKRFIRKDGEVTHWLICVGCARNSNGNAEEIFATAVDITDRKQAEEKMQKLVAELKQINADLQRFARFASHDLQAPLKTLEGFVKLFIRRYKGTLNAQADEMLGHMSESLRVMRDLIADLLEFSRIEGSDVNIDSVDTSLSLSEALFVLKNEIEEHGAVVTSAASMPVVSADRIQMTSLFQNLIGNAIKFNESQFPRIQVSVSPGEGEWVFSIKDNGIGIDPAYHSRIFDTFHRLHGKSEYPGTGLGLAICKRIIERQQGRIWVESEPGKGSEFFFTIPIKKGGHP